MAVTFSQPIQRLAPMGGPLVGREAELDRLRQAWAEARAGRCRLVLLAGEPGVGKTRLAAELAGEVEASGGDVVVGSCPAGGAEPYHPLIEALGPVPIGHPDRDMVFAELAAAAAARARRAPMLLVVDDLHRTDRSTLVALRRVVEVEGEPGRPCPLLVIATYRDTAVDRSHPLADFLAAVLPLAGVERLALVGLESEDLLDLVGDPDVARRVWRQSEGNPVRVRELVRLGALDRPLPPSFDELVARRMAGLTATTRRFLDAAALVGSEFAVPVAAEAAGVAADRVAAALKQLTAAGFVVEETPGPGQTRRFVHDMVREAIVGRIEPLARVRLHLRIGEALERLDPRAPAPAALLAWHFRAAAPVGGSARALHHSSAAAERAMELMAWEEAAVHYGYALAAATGASAERRADLLLSLGEAQRLAGETARARQAFLEAAKLARMCGDGSRLARAALALGQVAAAWGADPELEELAGEARTLLGQEGPAVLDFSPETDFATDALYDVLDGVPRQAPPAPVAAAPGASSGAVLRARHLALAGPEHTVERLATAEDAVAVADETGDDELAVTGWGWLLVDSMELGRLEQAAAHEAAHREVAGRLPSHRHVADTAAWTAMRAMLDGRADDARSASATAFALATEAGDPEAEDSYLVQRWALALEWGTPEGLLDVANACRARAAAAAGGREWRAAAALALARAGRFEPAAEELRRVTDHGLGELMRDPGRLHPLSCLAEVAWMLGDGYRAAGVGPMLEPFADRMVVVGRALACRGSVARACALVAAACGRWDEADQHFEAALAVHRRVGALPLVARTRYEWSRVLADGGRKGDRRRSAEHRRKAADLAERLRMTRLLEELVRPAA